MKTETIYVSVPFTIEYDDTAPNSRTWIIEKAVKELPNKLSCSHTTYGSAEIIRLPATIDWSKA